MGVSREIDFARCTARFALTLAVWGASCGGAPMRAARADGDRTESRLVALRRDDVAAPSQDSPREKSAKSAAVEKPEKPGVKNSKKPGAKPQNKLPATVRPAAELPPEKETRVREFVARHHPELAALLDHLKDNQHAEYERAVRDLDRAVERVESWRDRDARRHELELKQWQNQSRVDLLVARLRMANSEDYREPMRALLRERLEIKSELLKLERTRLVERLEKTDQQLQSLASEQDVAIENQLKVLLGTNKPGKPAKPAVGAKQKKSN